jgi:hypothetical protein
MNGPDIPAPDDRARALDDIAALARRHGLTAAEIADAIGAVPPSGQGPRSRAVLVKVLGFLGGIFVFAGVGVFIALQWSAMNSAARVVVTLGSGLAAFVLAMLASHDRRFEKASAPLFLIAGALQPTGMLVAFDEYGSGGDWRLAGLVVAGTAAVQFAVAYGSVRRSTPLFVAILFSTLFWWTALDLLELDDTVIAIVLGASLLLAAVAVDRTADRSITPVWYFLGAAVFLFGLFDAVRRTPFEIVFVAAASSFVYASVSLQTRTLLFVATLAILAYTGWFTSEHFAEALRRFGGLAARAHPFRNDHDRLERAGVQNRSRLSPGTYPSRLTPALGPPVLDFRQRYRADLRHRGGRISARASFRCQRQERVQDRVQRAVPLPGLRSAGHVEHLRRGIRTDGAVLRGAHGRDGHRGPSRRHPPSP